MAELIKWVITDSTKYAALATKDDNALYFLSDTKEIYRGSVSYTEPTVFFANADAKPAKGALGKIYIDSETLEGSVWTGTEFKTIIQPIAQSIDDANPTSGPVSGVAVKGYVTDRINDVGSGFVNAIGYEASTKSVTFTKGTTTDKVQLTELFSGVSYDGASGKLSFTDAAGTEVGSANLPLESFVNDGYYDDATESLILVMTNGTNVSIPAADLIKIYEAGETNSVKISITNGEGGNTIKADVKISAEAGNGLTIKDDGLYAAATDISGKADKLTAGHADEIVTAAADGNIALSGKKVGGATISDTANANTLATEAAVAAVKQAIEQNAGTTYVAKSAISTAVPDTAEAASDEKVVSEKAAKTAIDAALQAAKDDASANYVAKTSVVANEAGINTTTPSAEKVMSEAAFVEAFSWKVLP